MIGFKIFTTGVVQTMKSVFSAAAVLAILMSLASTVSAQTTPANPFVANIFSDNMVLQRGQADPIWGWTTPGTTVTVSLDNKSTTATAGADGYWTAKLPSLSAGGPHTVTVAGPQTVTFQNVLEGDVWICSGQSNMQFGIGNADNADTEIANANYPNIRINMQTSQIGNTPMTTNTSSWLVCTPDNIKQNGWNGFTAVGYFFGRDLYQSLNVPIGLIESNWGGTVAESWTSAPALRQSLPTFSPTLDKVAAAAAGTPPAGIKIDQNYPSELFNGMINPMIPYGIKGAIWYQGESNVGRGTQYRTLLPTMINDWRQRWNEGPFPFYIVQLANLGQTPAQPGDDGWAELRDAQLYTSETVPNTGIAVADDIGNPTDIHPKNKQEVGRRLSLVALAKTYGHKGEYSGPIYKSSKIVGSEVIISFDHVGGGLVSKDGAPLSGFSIEGSDHKWQWADAKIDGKNVDVSSALVPSPIAVRFKWSGNPVFNLYNTDGLPASEFRTDAVPVVAALVLPKNSGPNLALGATWVSSDQNKYGWDSGLTDGMWDAGNGTTYASGDADAFPKTVTVDLQKPAAIGLVAVGVPSFGSTKTIDVSLSSDGTTFTDVGSYVFTLKKEERHLFTFAPVNARYVRLTYPDHYPDNNGYTPTFVFTTELEAFAPENSK